MATPRKTRAGKRAKSKPAGVRRSSRSPAKKSVKPARRAAKPVRARAAEARRKTGAAVRPKLAGKAVARKGAAPVTARGVAPKAAARPAPAPVVRPLGVLPPESMVRSRERHAPPAARPRPSVARPPAPTPTIQGVERVTEQDSKFFEQRLLEDRQRILKEMGHLENTVLKVNQRDSSGDLSGYSFHMADAGTDAMEREKAFLFASAEGRTLLEINEALRRLYRGEYGVCETCGQPIARARLEAMPYARLCVPCKQKEEQAARGQGQGQG